jgi:WD40 repeat protein
MLAAGLYSGRLKLVDANAGCTRHDIEGHEGMVSCVALSENGRLLASGSRDRSVRIFCAWSGVERLVMRGHDAQSDCKVSQTPHSPVSKLTDRATCVG